MDFQVTAKVGDNVYTIDGGTNLIDNSAYLSQIFSDFAKLVLVSSQRVVDLFPNVMSALSLANSNISIMLVPDGEDAKSLAVVESCYKQLATQGVNRTDCIISLGGGAIIDLAGFIAGTWKRGTNLIHIPTTLLSQVDSSIGGKGAINLPDGKNIIGNFHQPIRVLIDTHALESLDRREKSSGFAEIIKHGFVRDASILDSIRNNTRELIFSRSFLAEMIEKSVRVKSEIVANDQFDKHNRRILNYGHTLGQCLETLTDYKVFKHGEAVALGMVFSALVSELVFERTDLVATTKEILNIAGLESKLKFNFDFELIWECMKRDKKVGDGKEEFVVCREPGVAKLIPFPSKDQAFKAFQSIYLK